LIQNEKQNKNDTFMRLMERFAHCSEKAGYHRGVNIHNILTDSSSEESKFHKEEEQQYLGLAKGCLHEIVEHLLKMKS